MMDEMLCDVMNEQHRTVYLRMRNLQMIKINDTNSQLFQLIHHSWSLMNKSTFFSYIDAAESAKENPISSEKIAQENWITFPNEINRHVNFAG